jgi:hypothetical protein
MPDRTAAAIEPSRRPLTAAERRVIRARIAGLTAMNRRASKGVPYIGAGMVLLLWVATLLASDAPWTIVTLFWLVVGGGLMVWVRRDVVRDAGHWLEMVRGLESALRRNTADVYDVRASGFAELEEIEDEGACYAFALDGDRLLFISGQQFYESARFPSLDFSLVYVLDEQGQTVDMLIDKRGSRVAPARTIPAAVKQRLDVPDHLEVRNGTLDDIEASLAPTSASTPE